MQKITSKDGTKIAYEKTGQGPAIILVDGALCHRGFGPMRPLAKLLSADFSVLAYDRRGRGESGDTQPFALEREIEDIEALISEAGGSAFVYGASSGGALGIHAAAQLPSIKKFAMYEAPFNDDPDAVKNFKDYAKKLNELLAQGQQGEAVKLFMAFVGTPKGMIDNMAQSPMSVALEAVAPTLAYDAAAMGDGSVPVELITTITIPMLAMAGTIAMTGGPGPAFMRDTAQAITKAAPHGTYQVLEGQTHDVNPEAIAPILAAFFKS